MWTYNQRHISGAQKPFDRDNVFTDMEVRQEIQRARATVARRLAKSVTDPQIREQLEMAARDYDDMADRLDKAARPQGRQS